MKRKSVAIDQDTMIVEVEPMRPISIHDYSFVGPDEFRAIERAYNLLAVFNNQRVVSYRTTQMIKVVQL